ncbi:MAG: iron-sulfur cluster assembly protein [Anaerolineae bacterium]
MATAEAVRQALCSVTDPLLGHNLVDLGMVQAVRIARNGGVTVQLALPSPQWPPVDELRRAIAAAIASLPGVSAVDVQSGNDPPWTPYLLSPVLKAPLGLPAEEPPALIVPTPSASSRVQRLLHRLRSR